MNTSSLLKQGRLFLSIGFVTTIINKYVTIIQPHPFVILTYQTISPNAEPNLT